MTYEYRTPSGITIIEGLEAVRRRPGMYLGDEVFGVAPCALLVERAVDTVAGDDSGTSAVRLTMWKDGVFTIAFDGQSLPIEPSRSPAEDIPHPEIYRWFMTLSHSERYLAFGCAILNALCERLLVSTIVNGTRYRAVFGKGTIISLLGAAHCENPLGTSWLTFAPDPQVISGILTSVEAEQIAKRAARERVDVSFIDRTGAEADWW